MNYTKDFQGWTSVKESVQRKSGSPPGYKEREIWWAQLVVNVGDEQDGRGAAFARPVLVIKGFSKYLVWAVPLTSNPKIGVYYYPFLLNGKIETAILSQLKTLDVRRFTDRIGVLDEQSFKILKKKLVDLLS